MKRFLSVLCILALVGCTTTSVPVDNPIPEQVITNQTDRLQWIGAFSTGINWSLDKQDYPTVKRFNFNITQLSEVPTPEQVKVVTDSIDNSAKAKELDDKLTELIKEKRANEEAARLAVEKLSGELATARNDKKAVEDELDKMRNPITAIRYGIVTIVKRLAWTIAGIGFAFMLLKIFANSNPVIGAIFDVAQRIVAWLIAAIASVFPKAIEFGSKAFQQKDETLTVLVDAIQAMPDDATMVQLKEQLAKDTNSEHRDEIDSIKKRLGWK